jgi:hypothetical protein
LRAVMRGKGQITKYWKMRYVYFSFTLQ